MQGRAELPLTRLDHGVDRAGDEALHVGRAAAIDAAVAEIRGCRASTVRNHLFAARRIMRRELEKRYPEYVSAQRREGGE